MSTITQLTEDQVQTVVNSLLSTIKEVRKEKFIHRVSLGNTRVDHTISKYNSQIKELENIINYFLGL
jgi:fructose-specific phosphotransferase system component IIB